MRADLDGIIAAARVLIGSCPCEFAEIRLAGGVSTSISLSGGQVESFSQGETVGGSVRVLHAGTWGFVSFNDCADLEKHLRRALAIASVPTRRERLNICARPPVRRHFATAMGRDLAAVEPAEKFDLMMSYNKILRSSRMVITTRAAYQDVLARHAYLNSEGSELTCDRAYCGVSLSSVARDGALIQPFHDSVSGHGGFEIAQGREDMAERVARTATDLLSAGSVPGGTYRVVADQKLAGVFIHEAFGHLSEADFVYENPRLRDIMVLGRPFGPEGLNVTDSGIMPVEAGHIPFDDEGILPGETRLITNGLLSGRLHSRETAWRMGEELTGNARAIGVMSRPLVRMTNTYIENGTHGRDEIIQEAGDGIYAAGFNGGMTNGEMFTFSSTWGHEIKKGKLGKRYRDIVLSGNVFTTLKNICMIGNDRRMFGGLGGCGKGGQAPLPVSHGGPHLLIEGVLIGGDQ